MNRMTSTVSHLRFSFCAEQGGDGTYLATMLAGGGAGALAGGTIGSIGGPIGTFIGAFFGAASGIVVAGVNGLKTSK